MIISEPCQFNIPDLFIDIPESNGRLLLKYEGMNFAGSIKFKTAAALVASLEESGKLRPGMTLVESTSGSLGIALAQIGAVRGYHVVCVIDPRCSLRSRRLMLSLGARLELVTEAHPTGGFLGARLNCVRKLLAADPDCVWTDQYHNPANWQVHRSHTGMEIVRAFPNQLDVVFVGIGTAGTGMGVAHSIREHSPGTALVAIDVVGSVTFGGPPGTRYFSGLGAGVQPVFFDRAMFDDTLLVTEEETVIECRHLARRGFVLGASTGSVLSGARRWLSEHSWRDDLLCVAVAPDGGDPYLTTLYDDDWVTTTFGPEVLDLERKLAAR